MGRSSDYGGRRRGTDRTPGKVSPSPGLISTVIPILCNYLSLAWQMINCYMFSDIFYHSSYQTMDCMCKNYVHPCCLVPCALLRQISGNAQLHAGGDSELGQSHPDHLQGAECYHTLLLLSVLLQSAISYQKLKFPADFNWYFASFRVTSSNHNIIDQLINNIMC